MMTELGVRDEAGAGFAPDEDNAHWSYAGPLIYTNAGAVLAAASGLRLPVGGEVDLCDVTLIDSAAVAVLLALKRRAVGEGRPLAFVNVPGALAALAELYGVEGMLAA